MPRIYDKNFEGGYRDVAHINAYLLPGPDIYVTPRSKPLCPVPPMTRGNQPTDDGNFIFSELEAEDFAKKYPAHKKFLHRYLGAKDFLHNKKRFCLWLKNVPPNEYRNNREIMRRLQNIKIFREKSSAAMTRKSAETPYKFFSTPQTDSTCIVIPRVSSEKRKYIPMDFVSPEIIVSDSLSIIPDAQVWHFGILTSSVHMAWTRLVAGRLKSDYRYSGKVVYNNFVWMRMEFIDYAELILAAQNILDVRKKYSDASLADLYDEVTMPKDLRDAHKKLDKIVLKIYGYDEKITEEEIQIDLLYRYQEVAEYRKKNPKKDFEEEEI